MKSDKVFELEKEIKILESRIEYYNSIISLRMQEANLCDIEITELTRAGLLQKEKLRDLRAELADTI